MVKVEWGNSEAWLRKTALNKAALLGAGPFQREALTNKEGGILTVITSQSAAKW